MEVRCAWCKKIIKKAKRQDFKKISHGICEDCAEKMLPKLKKPPAIQNGK